MSSVPSVHWFKPFKREEWTHTPSRKHGVKMEKEIELRVKMINFIENVGKRLKIRQAGIATAAIYFHYFYMRHSFKEHDKHDVASACLYLATKAEECRKSIREVAKICHMQQHKPKEPLQKDSPEAKELYKKIMEKEILVLQAVEFNFQVDHPYHFILPTLRYIFKSDPGTEETIRYFAQVAWCFVSDSLRSHLILFYPAQIVAVACVDLSFRFYNAKAEKDQKNDMFTFNSEWYSALLPDINYGIIEDVIKKILDVSSPGYVPKEILLGRKIVADDGIEDKIIDKIPLLNSTSNGTSHHSTHHLPSTHRHENTPTSSSSVLPSASSRGVPSRSTLPSDSTTSPMSHQRYNTTSSHHPSHRSTSDPSNASSNASGGGRISHLLPPPAGVTPRATSHNVERHNTSARTAGPTIHPSRLAQIQATGNVRPDSRNSRFSPSSSNRHLPTHTPTSSSRYGGPSQQSSRSSTPRYSSSQYSVEERAQGTPTGTPRALGPPGAGATQQGPPRSSSGTGDRSYMRNGTSGSRSYTNTASYRDSAGSGGLPDISPYQQQKSRQDGYGPVRPRGLSNGSSTHSNGRSLPY